MADINVVRTTTVRGQQKLASMKESSTKRPDLTTDQARQLYDAAEFPDILLPYKDRVIQYIVESYQALPIDEKLPFEYLLQSAKHICSMEATKYSKLFQEQFGVFLAMPPDSPQREVGIYSKLYSMAMLLSMGYQEQFKDHWFLDEQGNIVGIKPGKAERQPRCVEYLKGRKEKWRPSPVEVGYGGKKKKTLKKRIKKSKKTLRRK